MKRVFVIVLDSVGIGEAPDAAKFNDTGANTMKRISRSPLFSCENARKLGLGNIAGCEYLGKVKNPAAAYCRLAERSAGKDTTVGHWEIAGAVSESPLPTFPDGFPEELISRFSEAVGRGVLCNKPYSGTDAIKKYAEEHIKTGKLIVYTSADSVFQIAAHEDLISTEELYRYCRIAREMLVGKYGVGRVIARPFVGNAKDGYVRTSGRHDFSLKPTKTTMLDAISAAGLTVYGIGKINDIFAGKGITEYVRTSGNADGMKKTLDALCKDFRGICFVNLVDFDSQYGHRQDIDGYAKAFAEFDAFIPEFISRMKDDDALFITADHGCDPGDDSTDHTREYIPLLVYGKKIVPTDLGTRKTFSDIAATVCDMLGVDFHGDGEKLF